jgi:hypothetical protein|tara:strand:+ start:385 stop:882 length:498 start_codon:yes stop_codon:yes gene_type:complete
MTYKGKYRVTNTSKYKGDFNNVIYRSNWEKQCFLWCDRNTNIKEWSSEEVVIPYYYDVDKKYHRYFMDLKFTTKEGKVYLIEIKPEKETKIPKNPNKSKRYINEALTYVKNQNKWKAAEEYALNRGWHFQIWTERELQSMGILPKRTPGKLKSMKPLAPYRKKKK